LKQLLEKGQSAWKKASKKAKEDTGGNFVELPDGRYTARLSSAKLGESGNGRAQIAFGWVIADGEYEGKTAYNYQGIQSEDNLFYLGRDLVRLGYELPDSLSDLPEILKDIEKTKPMGVINLKTKGEYQNLYIRKIFDSMEEDGDDDTTEDEDAEVETDETEEETDETEESDDDAEASDDDAEEESDDAEADDDAEESDEAEEEDAEEESDDDGDEVELTEGMRVMAETAKGREAGEVIEILEKEGKVRVKLDNDKIVKVGVDRIEVEPEEEEAPAPKKKAAAAPAKKAAPAPVKKAAPPAKKAAAPVKKKTKR
jgi:chemotaxis protein histidine kinase CheA